MDFADKSCRDFVEALASKAPVPGGGGAAAYVGAIGMALGNMVGSLTLGKKKYANVQEDIIRLKEKADTLQSELLTLIKRDAEVFEPLSKAYGMSNKTEEEKQEKERVMEEALVTACSVPLEIMEKCCACIDLLCEFAEKGTAIAISDVGCGAACCKAALMAASLNVFINTKLMKNTPYADNTNEKASGLLNTYTVKADEIYEFVLAKFIR